MKDADKVVYKYWSPCGLTEREIHWATEIAAYHIWQKRQENARRQDVLAAYKRMKVSPIEPEEIVRPLADEITSRRLVTEDKEKLALGDWNKAKIRMRFGPSFVTLPAEYVPENPVVAEPRFIALHPTVDAFLFGGRLYERSCAFPGTYFGDGIDPNCSILFWNAPDATATTYVRKNEAGNNGIIRTVDPFGIAFLELRYTDIRTVCFSGKTGTELLLLEIPPKFEDLFIPGLYYRKLYNPDGPVILVTPKNGAPEEYFSADKERINPPPCLENPNVPRRTAMQLAS